MGYETDRTWDPSSGESDFLRELPHYIGARRERLKSNLKEAQSLKDEDSELLIQGRLYELEALQLIVREGTQAMARVIADERISIWEDW
jgi:hypothetical protein